MLVPLLPASATPNTSRRPPTIVVLDSNIYSWLANILGCINRYNRHNRPNRFLRRLDEACRYQQLLAETLSSKQAIWTLSFIKGPETSQECIEKTSNNSLGKVTSEYKPIHVKAYVVHVDMVYKQEISYKLTQDTIDALIKYHENVYCVSAKAKTPDWPDKEREFQNLHDDFVRAIKEFVFGTHVNVLKVLELKGSGKLPEDKSEKAKEAIISLMGPLLSPSHSVGDLVRPPELSPSPPPPTEYPQMEIDMPNIPPAASPWATVCTCTNASSSNGFDINPQLASMAMDCFPLSPALPGQGQRAEYSYNPPLFLLPCVEPLPVAQLFYHKASPTQQIATTEVTEIYGMTIGDPDTYSGGEQRTMLWPSELV
ncbi:hypothetical protein FALBO_11200 [Fusarium albosuccineum]|uniref:Uncharacterized protein n=1 Tax=Fusarium albosuccineum TaxID=1237068 RepID=A0A8H4L5M3_9HYPO|nr:hypothetical protein FALBO_11200 [Fusarium albosuccineum]